MAETRRWRLKSITIRSFRGVADEVTYAFDGRPGLLHGNNGVGKSTAAQCMQWTLYGRFPAEVLQNTALKGFMSPVSASTDAWYGQVTLEAGADTLVMTRDQGAKSFALETGGASFSGDEAEAQRDRLLGLDMAGFVRTVLLQQSRIRGLLLDLPRERNAALDRLLGMDDIENIRERLKPKDFTAAAEATRQKMQADRRAHDSKQDLLVGQRKAAEDAARARQFLNKDFNAVGLRNAYAAVAAQLQSLAARYDVALEPLPDCAALDDAPALSKRISAALRLLRTDSDLQRKLNETSRRELELATERREFEAALATLAGLQQQREAWFGRFGEHRHAVAHRAELAAGVEAARADVRAAGELRALLADARQFIEASPTDHCPVCEQPVSPAFDLVARLASRVESMSSAETAALEARAEQLGMDLKSQDAALADFERQGEALQAAQKNADELRARIIATLGGQGIAESKIAARLAEAIAAVQADHQQFAAGAGAMEEELAKVEEADRRIREGLVPVLRTRAELERLEDAWKATAASHVDAEAAAARLDAVADRLTRLRVALLDAKDDLVTRTLADASPRANEMYRRLVRHPVFDTLEIKTAPKANKVDYSFEVSSEGKKSTAREARLVLSDGQVTATAIALFFALSDSETHNLDLLYIDDPTQNLDLPCKEAMAGLVTEIAARRQVVVSTQDEDFVSFLEAAGFFDIAVVHHLERWNGNPVVSTRQAG